MAKKNRTIYIFRQYANPPSLPGSKRHFMLSKELTKRGHRIFIFPSAFHHWLKKEVRKIKSSFYNIEQIEEVNFVWIKTFPYRKNNWRRLINMVDYSMKTIIMSSRIFRCLPKPDIIIGSVAHSLALISAYVASRLIGCKYFVDIGDLWPEVFAASGVMNSNSIMYRFLDNLSNFAYKKANKIICVTNGMKEFITKKGIPSEKIEVLHNGIEIQNINDLNFFEPDKMKEKDRNNFCIVYTGSFNFFHPVKNIFEAAIILKKKFGDRFRFLLIGEGEQKNELVQLKERFDLKNFEIINAVPKDKLQTFYSAADAFILIEKEASFGFPNKLLDYMMYGKPIIFATPNRYEAQEFAGIKTDYNSDSIAKAVEEISAMDNEPKLRIRELSHRYLRQYHDISKIADKFEDLL